VRARGRPIDLEQDLCGFGVRGAAIEPTRDELINTSGQSALSRCQHKPGSQRSIG